MENAQSKITVQKNVQVPMRDGVNLSADIYFPAENGPRPSVLHRTPYDNNAQAVIDKAMKVAQAGFVFVTQDFRGRYDSEGVMVPSHNEAKDGHDTLEWIGQQDWCNGKIGTIGGSYLAIAQWQAAKEGSQYLKCMAPMSSPSDYIQHMLAPGGAFQLSFLIPVLSAGVNDGRTNQNNDHLDIQDLSQHLPLITLDKAIGIDKTNAFLKDWITTPFDSEYWTTLNMNDKYSQIAAPAFIASGWYDFVVGGAFAQFNGMRNQSKTVKAKESIVIVGPWAHGLGESTQVGDIDFGERSLLDLDDLDLQWLDYHLNGTRNDISEYPPVKIFVMGTNQWRDEQEWPLARTDWQTWYLSSQGRANTSAGNGQLSQSLPDQEHVDDFDYDPADPVPTSGGADLGRFLGFAPPFNQADIETRNDVLCYSTGALAEDMEVTGPIKAVLYAATDSLDTDWTAKIVDVSPGGYAKNICDGIIRARYREGLGEQVLLEPDKIYQYEIDAGVTSNVFLKGHRLRIEISSSNFPRFDRNPNTGHPVGVDTDMRVAHQRIYHASDYPSHVILPVIPE